MKRRIIAALMLVGIVSGCISTNDGPEHGGVRANFGQGYGPPAVPGVKGPYGEGVPMAGPYRPGSEAEARRIMGGNVPLSSVQMNSGGMTPPGMPSMPGMMPGGMPGMMPGGGMPPMM